MHDRIDTRILFAQAVLVCRDQDFRKSMVDAGYMTPSAAGETRTLLLSNQATQTSRHAVCYIPCLGQYIHAKKCVPTYPLSVYLLTAFDKHACLLNIQGKKRQHECAFFKWKSKFLGCKQEYLLYFLMAVSLDYVQMMHIP